MNSREKISTLQKKMEEKGLDAYIILSSDAHGSEYVSEYWRGRAWLSGFTGSAGTVALTKKEAGLWTDFRYYIQGAKELEGSGMTLFKDGIEGVPSYNNWLASNLKKGDTVGVDGRTISIDLWKKLEAQFTPLGIKLVGDLDLVGEIWKDRPEDASSLIWSLGEEFSGESVASKLQRVKDQLIKKGCDHYLISSLDDIAWTLNVRASDVPYNPVVKSYLLVGPQKVLWFVDTHQVSDPIKKSLGASGVELLPYDSVLSSLASLKEGAIYLSGERVNSQILQGIPKSMTISLGMDITSRLKAQKNSVEVTHIKKAMVKDGVAMVKFINWLKKEIKNHPMGEVEAAKKLLAFRSQGDNFIFESFSPIPGYGENGALCHYSAKEGSDATLLPKGLFLIDSGAQYLEGTTDITRTLSLGEPTEREREDYTLVLKGHVALSMAKFPRGTRGYQLDLLARQALWERGLNFGHGTGHGVGFVLNVHEGPQRISPHPVDEPLLEGMITSNEPGLYREGEHGIRIENLVLSTKDEALSSYEPFFCFDTLTLCPYDRDLIDKSLLCEREIHWINSYHKKVADLISPYLSGDDLEFLKQVCREL